MDQKKIGFAFFPRRLSKKEVDAYINELREYFPDALVMVSALQVQPEWKTLPLEDENISFVTSSRKKHDLVARAYPLIAQARVEKLDALFFNIGMLRYSPKVFAEFVKSALEEMHHADFIIGEPPFLHDDQDVEENRLLENPTARKRLLVDTFLNFSLARAMGASVVNFNAGLFGIKTTKDVITMLLSVKHYDDSALLSAQLVWHMHYNGFKIQTVPVQSIYLDKLGFNLDKAVLEIQYLIGMVEKRVGGVALRDWINQFFNLRKPFNRWMKQSQDEDWFWEVIVNRLKESRPELRSTK